ncbi:unnamed protein product, partial [Cochlearia groenlandica]
VGSKCYHHHRLNVPFQRPTFLPMLCSRPSIKNVILPVKPNQEDHQTDPLSPKISCIGQVKRSNKIVGFPTTTTTTAVTPALHHHGYFNVKRLFSGKNLTFSAQPTTTTKSTTSRGRIKKEEVCNKKIDIVDVAYLDPPLPVVKKTNGGGGGGDKATENLWKRRSGGSNGGLQIQLSRPHHLKITTV